MATTVKKKKKIFRTQHLSLCPSLYYILSNLTSELGKSCGDSSASPPVR